jgi:uncharacterized protein YjiS (DUF1127 family)
MSLISKLMTWIERSRLRQDLLQLDARLLKDAGFSRVLVEAGVHAWPWRTPTEPSAALLGRPLTEAEYRAAVAELESYSDTDLQDLGLSRNAIPEAVRNGRPGFPEDQQQAA